MIRFVCSIMLLLLLAKDAQTQNDTLSHTNVEYITDQLEYVAQKAALNSDYADLIDDYLFYAKNPLNLNGDKLPELLSLQLLNANQLNNLTAYLKKYGQLYSIYELKYIPGFNRETILRLKPFVRVKAVGTQEKIKLKKVFKLGRHQLLLRFQQLAESPEGFQFTDSLAIAKPASVYLGSPQKWYVRYAFNYRNDIRFGFTLEKDAGEVFLKSRLSDSLRSLVGDKVTNVFDFYSAFAFVSNTGILRKAIVGDYHLEFGQGITLWSGLAFGKSAEGVQIKRYGQGIRPNTSADENRFFRGAAFTLEKKGFSLTGFYSANKVDAHSTGGNLVDEETVSSLQETGLHRSINELLNKNVLDVQVYGGRLAYKNRFFELGATAFATRLGISLQQAGELYKLFSFYGDRLDNYGADLSLNLKKINFFGEASASGNGGLAGLAGLNAYLNDRFTFTLIYHNYGKDYQNLYTNPFAEGSAIANEEGINFGFRALLLKWMKLSGYLDYFRFPWLRYRTAAPSQGRDYLFQLDLTPAPKVNMYLRYRLKQQQENLRTDSDYLPLIVQKSRTEFRFFVSYSVSDFLVFKNRLDFVHYRKESSPQEYGYQVYQDILYRPRNFPLEISFRYALFDTDGYNSRIYTYENDVLYAYSIPAYFGKGQRFYLMLKWTFFDKLNLWLRVARVVYDNRNSVGSGPDEIAGNHKTEFKAQLRLKL